MVPQMKVLEKGPIGLLESSEPQLAGGSVENSCVLRLSGAGSKLECLPVFHLVLVMECRPFLGHGPLSEQHSEAVGSGWYILLVFSCSAPCPLMPVPSPYSNQES